MLDAWMKELSQLWEMEEPFQTNVPGVYSIPLGEDVSITLTEGNQNVSLSSIVTNCPKKKEEEFYLRALLANLFGQGTRSAVLGLSEDGNQLTLNQTIRADSNYDTFHLAVEDFINTIDFWREEAKNY